MNYRACNALPGEEQPSHGRVNGSARVVATAAAVDLVRFGRIAAARGDCRRNGRGDSLAAGQRQRVETLLTKQQMDRVNV